jgi:hypothetical protein
MRPPCATANICGGAFVRPLVCNGMMHKAISNKFSLDSKICLTYYQHSPAAMETSMPWISESLTSNRSLSFNVWRSICWSLIIAKMMPSFMIVNCFSKLFAVSCQQTWPDNGTGAWLGRRSHFLRQITSYHIGSLMLCAPNYALISLLNSPLQRHKLETIWAVAKASEREQPFSVPSGIRSQYRRAVQVYKFQRKRKR